MNTFQTARAARLARFVEANPESDRREKDARLIFDWQVRFQAARNATCEGQKNFRGV